MLADIVEIFVYLCRHVAEAVSIEDRAVLDVDAGGIENVAVRAGQESVPKTVCAFEGFEFQIVVEVVHLVE